MKLHICKKKDIFHIQTNNSQLLQLVWKTRCVLSTHLCVHARADIHTHAFVHAWRSEVNFRCRPSWFLRQGPKISHGIGAHPLGQAVWPGSQGSCLSLPPQPWHDKRVTHAQLVCCLFRVDSEGRTHVFAVAWWDFVAQTSLQPFYGIFQIISPDHRIIDALSLITYFDFYLKVLLTLLKSGNRSNRVRENWTQGTARQRNHSSHLAGSRETGLESWLSG